MRKSSASVMCVLLVVFAAAIGAVSSSRASANAVLSTAAMGTRVLEVAVQTPAGVDGAAELEAIKTATLASSDAARKQAGCVTSTVTLVAANPRGGSAAVVRATEWASVEDAEAGSLAMDAGAASNPQLARSYFRLLRESKVSDGEAGHLEVVVFRTKPGVTREANLESFDKGEADYIELGKGEGGLISHSLWIAPDGRWVHLLHWRSETDYAKTGKALFAKPGVGGWIRSLDFGRFTVYRGDITASQSAATPKGE